MTTCRPSWSSVVLATLLVAVIGTWAGLTLGVSTMLTKDIYKRFIRSGAVEPGNTDCTTSFDPAC